MKKITRHLEKMLAFVCLLGVSTSAWAAFTKTEKIFDTWNPTETFDPEAAKDQTAWVITGSGTVEELKDFIGDNAIRLLDLSGATITDGITSTAPFAGKNLTSVVLPKGISDVKAEWFTGCTNLYAAVSYNEGVTELAAYVNKPGTLKNTFADIYLSGNTDLKSANQAGAYVYDGMLGLHMAETIKKVKLSGTLNAIDISDDYNLNISDNGNIAFDSESVENYDDREGHQDLRTLSGSKLGGALMGIQVSEIDLSDAFFPKYTDMTFTYCGMVYQWVKVVKFPTDSRMNTIPAYCFSAQHGFPNLREICIPSNYTTIKTCAFAVNGIHHIWTTENKQTDPNIEELVYDNGAVVTGTTYDNSENAEKYRGYVDDGKTVWWGTYTFSSNLKLIESYAFAQTQANVRDVYNLSLVAPECHVDAFNTKMYSGINGFVGTAQDGMVTRDSYFNNNVWITMLHYPREAVTPNTQRYTDPQRRYSIATGMVDGKGGTIYFPTQSEFARAYEQGTYGYTWNAFDPERAMDGSNGFKYGTDGTVGASGGWCESGWRSYYQDDANKKYNDYYYRCDGANKNCVFYETDGEGVTITPKGLTDYSTLYWSESNNSSSGSDAAQLYPKAVKSVVTDDQGNPVQEEVFVYDKDGNLQYEKCENGDYVREETEGYVTAPNGEYIQIATVSGYEAVTSPVDGVTTYYSDNQGTEATPKVGRGFYKGVEEANYTEVDKNNDVIGSKDVYFVKDENGSFVESSLEFSTPLYYKTGVKITKKEKTWFIKQGVTAYYSLVNGEYVEVFPNLTGPSGASCAYKDANGYHITSTYVKGESEWYVTWDNGQNWTAASDQMQISFGAEYYYDGTEEVDEYKSTSVYLPTVSDYYAADGDVNPVTLSWWNHIKQITYYYLNGTHIVYYDATNSEYDPSTTYYTDNTGSTMAETVTFDQTYYIPTYTYTYELAGDNTEGDRYTKTTVYSYREFNPETDANVQRWCPMTELVNVETITQSNDYRGWHQFVLVGTSTNSDVPFEPYRSYMTDNDWWTICAPYSLTYNEMMTLFGDNGMPHLCRLLYVIRDVDNGEITLNFSKNLMKQSYKEDASKGIFVEDAAVKSADNPVILEAGVPYMIRPNRQNASNFTIDVKNEEPNKDLYEKLYNLNHNLMSGSDLKQLVEDGIYTVPAFTINDTKNAEHSDGVSSVFTYKKNGTDYNAYPNNVSFTGKETPGYTYSFVGSFYNSLLPQYAYFLGYNDKTKKVVFFYNDQHDTQNWRWANYTGIIMANWDENNEIHTVKQSTATDPAARWTVIGAAVNNDDFAVSSGSNKLNMVFDAESVTSIKGISESINNDTIVDGKVYNVNGQYVGNDIRTLSKGLYIINGKKIVIK